jgi:putative transposase
VFADKYGAKYDKAVACLTKDRATLLALFDFPAEHWDHLRTSNPVESVFATVRHRTVLSRRRPPNSWYLNSSMPPQKHGDF